jgi:hypothetical protein
VDALELRGWTVKRISAEDFFDLIAARFERGYGRVVIIECKTGNEPLTEGQQQLLDTWPGETAVLRSAEDALAL